MKNESGAPLLVFSFATTDPGAPMNVLPCICNK